MKSWFDIHNCSQINTDGTRIKPKEKIRANLCKSVSQTPGGLMKNWFDIHNCSQINTDAHG
jgi:hypothetical protein